LSTQPPQTAPADAFDDAFADSLAGTLGGALGGNRAGSRAAVRPALVRVAAPLIGANQATAIGQATALSCALLLTLDAAPPALVVALVSAAVLGLTALGRVATLSAEAWLLTIAAFLAALLGVAGTSVLALPIHTLAVALGALVAGRRLAIALPLTALLLVVGLARVEGAVQTLVHALFVFAFGALGRGLFFGTLRAAQHRQQQRIDGEMLRLTEDARLLRLLGTDVDGGDLTEGQPAHKQLLARTLAAKDACYRLLDLGARALGADGAALYLWDDVRARLVLKEQCVEGEHAPMPVLTERQGVPGLAHDQARAVRLCDDGPTASAHRRHAAAVLAVPLRDGAIDSAPDSAPRGVLVFDRTRAAPFSEADERLALALARELVDALATERVLAALDQERRRIARVLTTARTLSGVVRLDEVLDQIAAATHELMPNAQVGLFTLERPEQPTDAVRVCAARVRGLSGVVEGQRTALDEQSWLGRAVLQREALPHTRLADAPNRGLLCHGDDLCRTFGDVLVLPLVGQGDVGGVLAVATPAGLRWSANVRAALLALADLAGMALAGAQLFFLVEQRASTDGLTGLLNRRTLDEKLAEALARSRRSGGPLAVVITDIDHFKRVNDTYGHATGDDVLKAVAHALKRTARQCDVVARYGGEEFVLLLEGTDQVGALQLAERARTAVKGLSFATDKGPLAVTSSFGVSLLAPGDTGAALVERADQNLYRAKHAGRDRVVGPTSS
jgi:diguanylate cyclase (GGDEF)-like protein